MARTAGVRYPYVTDSTLPIQTNVQTAQGFDDAGFSSVADSWMTLWDVLAAASDRSLYFVVTIPDLYDLDKFTSFTNFAGGYHSSVVHTEHDTAGNAVSNPVPYGWGGVFGSTLQAQIDSFSRTFSHELVEARTDPYINVKDGDANRYSKGTDWKVFDAKGNQITNPVDEIADFEPDGYRYTYRLGGQTLVEPFWSQSAHAFVVNDGNSQVFTLDPRWGTDASGKLNQTMWRNQFDLAVKGDQRFDHNDTITIGTTRDGGVSVTLNGETVSFDAGQIRNLDVDARSGNDTINVESLPKDVKLTINEGGQSGDSVNITPLTGNPTHVEGAIYVHGGFGHNTLLTIDDSNLPPYILQTTFEVKGGTIIRHDHYSLATVDSTIHYDGVGRVKIRAGSQTTDVAALIGSLAYPFSIGVLANGHTSVTTNESPTTADSGVYSLSSGRIARTSSRFGTTVAVDYSGVSMANINAVQGAVYNISQTFDTPVSIYAGTGSNTFNVGNVTDGLGQIGQLNIFGKGRQNKLVVDDRASVRDPSGYLSNQSSTFDLSGTSSAGSLVQKSTATVGRRFPFTVTTEAHVNYSGVQNVSILAGTVDNTFNLIGPDPGIRLGKLAIQGGVGSDTLILDDTSLLQPATYTVEHTKLRRTTPTSDDTLNFTDIDNLQIKAGGKGNVFKVNDAPGPIAAINAMAVELDTGAGVNTTTIAATTGPVRVVGQGSDSVTVGIPGVDKSFVRGPLNVSTGTGANTINVNQTTAPLSINSTNPDNMIVIGAKGGLSQITGAVTLQGVAKSVTISDAVNTFPMSYAMDATHFTPTSVDNVGYIVYGGLTASMFNFTLGNGGNTLYIDGTPTLPAGPTSSIRVATGKGSDSVHVWQTNAPLSIDLGAGANQSIALGDASHSLDAIHSAVYVAGGGLVDASVSNAASATPQVATIDSLGPQTISVARTQYNVDHYDSLNSFSFKFQGQGRMNYSAGQGGDIMFVHGTPKNVVTNLFGGSRQDVFWVEGDQAPLLSPVFVNGTTASGDYAYYYDYFSTVPQTYTFQAGSSNPNTPNVLDTQIVKRAGAAPITYMGLVQLVTYQARVGGNQTNIQGVPTGEFLNMVIPDKDKVRVGTTSAGMTQILGSIDLGYGKQVSVTLDDMNDATGRNIVLHPKVDAYGDWISGMSPGTIYFRLGDNSSVKLLGGLGSDTFAMAGTSFVSAMSIDGGTGFNTLDYSMVPNPSSVSYDLSTGLASGLDGGFKHIQQVTGVP